MKKVHYNPMKIVLVSTAIVTAMAVCKCNNNQNVKQNLDIDLINVYQDKTIAINKNLLDILFTLGFIEEGSNNEVESINAIMQQNFIRKPGTERWNLNDEKYTDNQKNKVKASLKNLNMVDAIEHFDVDCDYFLLFGALLARMQARFDDFLEQYKKGTLKCKNIILLGGIRKLKEDEIESIKNQLGDAKFQDFCNRLNKEAKDLTEADALDFIWENYATDSLRANFVKKQNLHIINSTDTSQGANNRPTTTSTIEAWLLEHNPASGKCHSNVEKPYGVRMRKNLELSLHNHSNKRNINDFSITWNSPHSSPETLIAVYLDELARAFYQEKILKTELEVL